MSEFGDRPISEQATAMLRLLEHWFDNRPLCAIDIADKLNLSPNRKREIRRRDVRFLATELRNAGHRVCANGDGYWLARSQSEYEEYLAAMNSRAVMRFVESRKRRDMTRDENWGQGVLFEFSRGAFSH